MLILLQPKHNHSSFESQLDKHASSAHQGEQLCHNDLQGEQLSASVEEISFPAVDSVVGTPDWENDDDGDDTDNEEV